ncbi:hypothetical protein FBU30_006068 [Linnemannia zychae]|nr:hypothetical protein FBU30_006068 [Linnemannia zychae]
MHLDDSSQTDLKEFLTQELALISDADPAMLADYIIALLKHDKENDELKELCVSQLEDFLQGETESFVDMLFKALATKSYRSIDSGVTTSAQRSYGSSSVSTSDRSSHQRQEKHHRGDSDASDDEDRSYKHARREDTRDVSSSITSNNNNNNSSNRRRDYSPSRPSDDNRADSRRGGRYNDSNASGLSDSDRRGDRSSQGGYMRQQGLTTAGYNNRNNSNNNNIDRNQRNGGEQRSQFQDGSRGNFQDQQGNGSWRGGANNARGNRSGVQSNQGFGQDRPTRQRCRDYDEKGFCLRGDMCPYDHGDDRIVVDELAQVPFGMMGVPPGMGPNGMMGMGMGRPPFFPNMPNEIITPHGSDMYDADGAPLSETMGARFGTESTESWRTEGSGRFDSTRGNPRGRGNLRGMRGGRGRGSSSHPYAVPGRFAGSSGGAGSKTSLVVENIPDEFNTIDKVNEFFKTFGSLTNIQVDQLAHKALIQYSTREEASAAYNSPEVIFGNRFVKVYWQPDDLDSATFGRQPKPTGQVRPDPVVSTPHYSMTPATSVLMTPERAAELAEERAAAAAKKEENKKTMQEIQRQKEALIQRQQEEQKLLLQKLFANKNMSQKDKDEILSGLRNVAVEVTKEPTDPHAQARAAAAAAETQRQADLQKEAEKLEKARLDNELESLNNAPTASTTSTDAAETTAALKAKLAALQAQAAALGLEQHGGYSGRGRGGYVPRGRGRGAPVNTWTRGGGRGGAIVSHHRTYRIDNRSTKLSVQNVDDASKEGLLGHFEAFGEVESFIMGADGTSATVQYKNRKDAEMALQQGGRTSKAGAGPMKLSWINDSPAPTAALTPISTELPKSSTPVTGSVETQQVISPDANAAMHTSAHFEHESEDEEHGERSWKR